ncbi:hypothetical protein ElyMa_002386900 [Elysia marginata]|uniref:Uncharacterized protein n=1 Tax=Elysia marginata TaxID=1093978 RepID=A0AAV4GC22_9GAST|nr:hypothetical protein ElyMa_002386900 [Elysia marginata]
MLLRGIKLSQFRNMIRCRAGFAMQLIFRLLFWQRAGIYTDKIGSAFCACLNSGRLIAGVVVPFSERQSHYFGIGQQPLRPTPPYTLLKVASVHGSGQNQELVSTDQLNNILVVVGGAAAAVIEVVVVVVAEVVVVVVEVVVEVVVVVVPAAEAAAAVVVVVEVLVVEV